MAVRKIIEIDEELCNGCGNCIPNCPEGALQLIDGKARLISDLFCDGLGACIGECPVDAINVIEREAEPYNETKVMQNIVKHGPNTIAAHLKHLKDHNETAFYNEAIQYLKDNNIDMPAGVEDGENKSAEEDRLPCGCPGSAVMDFKELDECEGSVKGRLRSKKQTSLNEQKSEKTAAIEELLEKFTDKKSRLSQWPIQIMLVPPMASYLKNADLLIAADCVPFAYGGFHQDFLEGKAVLIGCPKLDDSELYIKKFTEIFKMNDLKSITVVHMEVPCCFGLLSIVKQALNNSGKNIELKEINIGVKGNIVSET